MLICSFCAKKTRVSQVVFDYHLASFFIFFSGWLQAGVFKKCLSIGRFMLQSLLQRSFPARAWIAQQQPPASFRASRSPGRRP